MTPTETVSETGTVTFRSVRKALRLVRVQGDRQATGPGGQQVKTVPGITYEFDPMEGEGAGETPGQLVLEKGRDTLQDGPPGEDGEPTFQDAIDWMRGHNLYNSHGDGFFEVGAEPDHVPDSGPALASIAQAAAAGDRAVVEQVLSDENEGYQREDVIGTAQAALDALEPEPPPAV